MKILNTKLKELASKKYLWVLVLLVGILIPSTIFLNYLGNRINEVKITELSQFDTGGDAVDVEVHYDIAYVSDMNSNLLNIIDVSDPSHPVLLSTFQAHGNHQLTVVANGTNSAICYLTDHNYGLYILNVSDPTNPQILSQYTDPGEIDDLVVIDDYAYVIDQEDGLEIVDISDPTDPQKLGDFSYGVTGYHVDVIVRDEIAYLTDVRTGLTVVNISDPTNMYEIGTYYTDSEFYWMEIQGNYLFVPNQENINILDISNPAFPTLYSTINDTGAHGVISIQYDLMYVSDFEEGLEVYDVSDLQNPEKLITFFDGGIPFGHWVKHNLIFVADKSDGLEILELTLPHYED